MSQKVALVTGASSGFGQLTAEQLAAAGYTVFGTSRSRLTGGAGVEMIALDVRSPESVTACVETVLGRAGRIDVLVNNAGETHSSLVEETPLDIAMRVFETNFWGVVRVTQAVLPGMRARRSGVIINVGSLAGLVGAPGQGFYAASKHALEGYSETLRAELWRFGVRVSLIEPGFFRTNIHHAMLRGANRVADYDGLRERVEAMLTQAVERGDDPRKVANTIVAAAQAGGPKLRYRVGTDAAWFPRLKFWLPERWFVVGMRRRFRMNSRPTSS